MYRPALRLPTLPYNEYRLSFSGVKRTGVALTTHPLYSRSSDKHILLLLCAFNGLFCVERYHFSFT